MTDRVGQQLGNYQLIRLLGEGGFAEVYLGEHIHLGTPAAIKVLHTQLTSEDVDKFRTEARTIARLIHPNIVRVLEFGLEGKTPFLVMDYASNGTLRQKHARGERVPLATVIQYVKQIANGLQHAHEENLVHRDVKPENMLLDRRGEVLLGDFGIALVAQSSRYQSTQEMAGTMAYMAPEQIQGKPRAASDQYSLGVAVYEWLSGERPFHGSMTEIIAQHLAVSPPPLSGKLASIAPHVERVVMIALEKDPHRRFASVQAFATALEQASQGDAPTVLNSTSAAEVTAPSQRANVKSETPPPVSQPVGTVVCTYRGHSSPVNFAAWSPDGNRVASASSDRTVQVWNFPLSGGAYTYGGHAQPVWHMAWSPDNAYIASVSGDRTLLVWNVDTGRTVFNVGGGIMASWSRQNSHLALTSYDRTVQIWDVFAKSRLFIYDGHVNGAYAIAWSPVDARIASTGKNDATVQVWNSMTGRRNVVYAGHSAFVPAIAWSPDGTCIASASHDKTVQVWDSLNGELLCTYRGHTGRVLNISWSPNGKYIVSTSVDRTLQIWDVTTNRHIFTVNHNAPASTVEWSPDGKHIVSGGDERFVRVLVAP